MFSLGDTVFNPLIIAEIVSKTCFCPPSYYPSVIFLARNPDILLTLHWEDKSLPEQTFSF